MHRWIHPAAAMVGMVTVLTFWISTVAAELAGSLGTITMVKQAIPWGLPISLAALATTGLTGKRLAGSARTPQILAKKRRTPIIAANGVLILTPAAITLAVLASRGQFGPLFYGVQALELAAGAVNLTLMSLNARDGLRLTGRIGMPVANA